MTPGEITVLVACATFWGFLGGALWMEKRK